MKIHKVEEAVTKAIRDIEIELTAMETGDRNQFNETRESLASERTLLTRLAGMIEDWQRERSQEAIDRMESLNPRTQR